MTERQQPERFEARPLSGREFPTCGIFDTQAGTWVDDPNGDGEWSTINPLTAAKVAETLSQAVRNSDAFTESMRQLAESTSLGVEEVQQLRQGILALAPTDAVPGLEIHVPPMMFDQNTEPVVVTYETDRLAEPLVHWPGLDSQEEFVPPSEIRRPVRCGIHGIGITLGYPIKYVTCPLCLQLAAGNEAEYGLTFKYRDRVKVGTHRESYRAGDTGAIKLVDLGAQWPYIDVEFEDGDTHRYLPTDLTLAPTEDGAA